MAQAPAPGDLTTLAAVQAWLFSANDVPTSSEAVLGRLITQVSRAVLNQINRASIAVTTFAERYDGHGKPELVLRNYPVVAVRSIEIAGGPTLTAASDGSSPGWLIEPGSDALARVVLVGHSFPKGRLNVRVTYDAGYQTTDTAVVPSTGSVSTLNTWLADAGVTYANGAALTAVAANPAAGQYAVADGAYSFNASDAGRAIAIAYSYVSADLEQAVIQIVAEQYRARDRIGEVSKTLGGQETIAFQTTAMNAWAKSLLSAFTRIAPV